MKYRLTKRRVGDEDKAASKMSPVTEGKQLTQRELNTINGKGDPSMGTHEEPLMESLRTQMEQE